jgi:hypothetical protein
MAVTQTCNEWVVVVEIDTPTSNAYLDRTIVAGGYLIETLEELTETLTGTATQGAGVTQINYVVTETEPAAGTLTALSTLFTTFGFTVVP